MPIISQETQKLISRYKASAEAAKPKEGTSTIHVDEVASRVAAFYEKVRGFVDWREEHLLRRAAIERVLRRKFFLRVGQKIDANPVILELIRAGHFPNDAIDEQKIPEIQSALDKYIYIMENRPKDMKVRLQEWLTSVAACELEEILDPQRKERALIEYMTALMEERIKVQNGIMDEEKNRQTYIAVHRALFKLDSPIISYQLIKRMYPGWSVLKSQELETVTRDINSTYQSIQTGLNFPLSEKFYRVCEKKDTPYLILGDILSEDPAASEEKLKNPETLESAIRKSYESRLSKIKSKLARAAIYSTISIFLTKILVAIAVEYPFDKYVTQEFTLLALILSVAIPPALMLFLLLLASTPPSKTNLQKVVVETMKIAYESEKKDVYNVKLRKRGGIMNGIIFLFYLATFVASFWLIWQGLERLEFSWLSKIIFIIFFSLISYAGTKIRERAKELSVEEEKAGFFGFLFDWFFLPFVLLGKWLSSQWTKYNIVLVLIITLVDLPFQIFVEFLEQWRYFLKEKKEEIH